MRVEQINGALPDPLPMEISYVATCTVDIATACGRRAGVALESHLVNYGDVPTNASS